MAIIGSGEDVYGFSRHPVANLSIILLLIFASSASSPRRVADCVGLHIVYHPLEAPVPVENTWAPAAGHGQSGKALCAILFSSKISMPILNYQARVQSLSAKNRQKD